MPKFCLYDDFSPFSEVILKKGGKQKHIPAKTLLHEATSEIHTAYYIKQGLAKFSLVTEEGTENLVFFYGEGSIFPVNCSTELFALESFMTFTAITDLEVIAFPASKLAEIAYDNKDFVSAIIFHYSHYASSVLTRLMLRTYNDSVRLLATFLYLYSIHSQEDGVVDLTQEEIGNMLGISRVQVSRAISTLKQDNSIQVNHKAIKITDIEKLKYRCSSIVLN